MHGLRAHLHLIVEKLRKGLLASGRLQMIKFDPFCIKFGQP